MKNLKIVISKRDSDLAGLISDIGPANFKKLVRLSLRSLLDPSIYNENEIKSILSERQNVEITYPYQVRIALYADKNADLVDLLNSVSKNSSPSYFAKVCLRNFLGVHLYKYFFDNKMEFIALDQRVIPILSSARINLKTRIRNLKVATQTVSVIETEIKKEEKPFIPAIPIETETTQEFVPLPSTNQDDDDFDVLSLLEDMIS